MSSVQTKSDTKSSKPAFPKSGTGRPRKSYRPYNNGQLETRDEDGNPQSYYFAEMPLSHCTLYMLVVAIVAEHNRLSASENERDKILAAAIKELLDDKGSVIFRTLEAARQVEAVFNECEQNRYDFAGDLLFGRFRRRGPTVTVSFTDRNTGEKRTKRVSTTYDEERGFDPVVLSPQERNILLEDANILHLVKAFRFQLEETLRDYFGNGNDGFEKWYPRTDPKTKKTISPEISYIVVDTNRQTRRQTSSAFNEVIDRLLRVFTSVNSLSPHLTEIKALMTRAHNAGKEEKERKGIIQRHERIANTKYVVGEEPSKPQEPRKVAKPQETGKVSKPVVAGAGAGTSKVWNTKSAEKKKEIEEKKQLAKEKRRAKKPQTDDSGWTTVGGKEEVTGEPVQEQGTVEEDGEV